jgi:DNA-binding transcriptional MocR family regulator
VVKPGRTHPTSPLSGLSLEALAFALEHQDAASPIRAVVTMPTLHNPLGCAMPDERKAQLVRLAAATSL